MYSYGPPHIAEKKQDDRLKHTYSSYVRIRGVSLKTRQRRWTIGKSGERKSGISVLAARHDDDDDLVRYIFCFLLYKKVFLRKKKPCWPHAALDLAWFGKGRSNPRQCGTKKWLPPVVKLLFDHQYKFGVPNWRHENLIQENGFITRFTNGASQEIKVKINESWQLKFYQENSTKRKFNWKKIQPRILRKRTLKKTRNLMNSETFR